MKNRIILSAAKEGKIKREAIKKAILAVKSKILKEAHQREDNQ